MTAALLWTELLITKSGLSSPTVISITHKSSCIIKHIKPSNYTYILPPSLNYYYMFRLYDHQQGRVIHTDSYLRLLHTIIHPSDQVTYDYFLPHQSII